MSAGPPPMARAEALLSSGRAAEAKDIAQRFLRQRPGDLAAQRLLARAHYALGEREQALFFLKACVAAAPDDAALRVNLARLQHAAGDGDGALQQLREAVGRAPAFARARTDLVQLLIERSMLSEALRVSADASGSMDAELAAQRVQVLMLAGDAEGALAEARRIAAADPRSPGFAIALAMASNYADLPAAEVFGVHTRAGALLEVGAPDMRSAFDGRDRSPDRTINVGVLSSDMRTHSVAYFFEPLLGAIDQERFPVTVYHTNRVEDATTARLKAVARRWREMPRAYPADCVRRILDDRIDVLIDLAGYTNAAGVSVMAAKPAPVQATYLGYPNTIGLPRIDARLVDSRTDPAGSEALATEKLLRLDPCFVCYGPPTDAPPVPPRAGGRPVAFGSFNATLKITPRAAGMWRRALDATPGSRMIIKASNFVEADLREAARARLAGMGLPMDRVEVLEAKMSSREHLETYGRVDVALDTYPYHGTTTTCEAMWMGVPVVTLAGDRHVSRVGVSLLNAVGLPDLVAQSEDEYVRIASALAADKARLAGLRASLRERVRTSPLCDAPAFARRFEDALRALWRAWCGRASA
ncbi:MAG TPA: tetratricopeptide repeat protein [Phycisphaerales bacterium]|nr:tetratricopeptide repeat protein [Phycisphaerales bacterium]